jgi:hypothetical protein
LDFDSRRPVGEERGPMRAIEMKHVGITCGVQMSVPK